MEPDIFDSAPVFTSSDEKVATVDLDGMIKAVAPGRAGITVQYDGAEQVIVSVECDWKAETTPEEKPEPKPDPKPEEKPEPKPDPKPEEKPEEPEKPAENQVILSEFFTATTGKYQFSFMMEADDASLTNFFAGLSDLSLEQRLVYLCGMSPPPTATSS